MDWLKRNWVDVLMGGLIFAIAAGVLVVLLRGGLFVSSNPNANPPVAVTPATTTPEPTISTPEPNAVVTPEPTISTPEPSTVVTPKPNDATPAPTQKPQTNPSTTTPAAKPVQPRATASLSVPEIPEAPNIPNSSQSSSSSKPTTSNTSSPTTQKPTEPVATKPPTQTTPTTTRPNTDGSYNRGDFLRNYRVAAGSYKSLEGAQRASAQLRARGLPAQYFSSGNTYVVVVGPYAREASARAALTKVRQSLPDAILYRPDGSREAVAAQKPTTKPQTQSGGGGSSPATLTAVAYLQIGAFKDSKSASGLLEKLKNAGFNPLTKNISGLLRVLVGPLQSSQIESTRTTLKNQGFDAFPINL